VTQRELPPPPPYCSDAGRAERMRLWKQRLAHEDLHGLREGDERAFKTFRMRLAAWGITLALRACGMYEAGVLNATRPALRHIEWRPARLPRALDGVRLLHISDLHFSRFERRFTEGAAQCLDGVEADLLLITGDYRFGHYGPAEHVPHHLREVLHGVKIQGGTYATLGNHDLAEMAADLRGTGIDVLVNEGRLVELRGETLWIGGTDDEHSFRCASVSAALDGRPPGAFTLLLSHTPEMALAAARAGVDLYLCGHTHGGQMCLPGGFPLKLNARCPRRFTRGAWREGDMLGLTTNGMGTTDLPLRFHCPAEAHLITLRAA
jgi:predicted MPP superfamily phosphohydrolase